MSDFFKFLDEKLKCFQMHEAGFSTNILGVEDNATFL